ncbi:MAG TPA: GNAT family N-acetyltransferase [Burkholderiaceae bacterium]|nr:GNAT family N-acetyltransferase [Burkholderiaceae bacterium]
MSTDIVIRGERADHPQVATLLTALDAYLAQLYPPEANHILSIDELLAPDVTFLAAWLGDRVVGTGALRRMAGEPATQGLAYGEIKRMYVTPGLRGGRLGRRLVESLELAAREEGLTLALLETGRDQHEAVRLYERCGYVARAAFGGYPDNGLSLFMQKSLRACTSAAAGVPATTGERTPA